MPEQTLINSSNTPEIHFQVSDQTKRLESNKNSSEENVMVGADIGTRNVMIQQPCVTSDEYLITNMEDDNFRFTNTSCSQQYASNGIDQANINLDYVAEQQNRASQDSSNNFPRTMLTSDADREEQINTDYMMINTKTEPELVQELSQDQYYDEEAVYYDEEDSAYVEQT